MSQTSNVSGLTVDNPGNDKKSASYEETSALDPDYEARLYAEIYYTNDDYQPSCESDIASAKNSQNCVPASGDNFVVDSNPGTEEVSSERLVYPSRSWVLGERNEDGGLGGGRRSLKRQRPLAHKGLWLPRVEPGTQRNQQEVWIERQSAGSPGSAGFTTWTEETRVSGAVGNRREPGIFGAVGNRQETGIFGAVGNRQETGIFGAVGNRRETGIFGSVGNHQETGNFGSVANRQETGIFGSNANRQETGIFGPVGNRKETGVFGAGGSSKEPVNFASFGNLNEAAENFSRDRDEAGIFGTFGSRNEVADFASVRKRTNASVVRSTRGPGRWFTRFVDEGNDPENVGPLENRFYSAANDCPQFSGVTNEVENIRPVANRFETGENFARFPSGAIAPEHVSAIASCLADSPRHSSRTIDAEKTGRIVVNPFHEPANNFIRLGDGDFEAWNITPVGKRFNRRKNYVSRFGGEAAEAGSVARNRRVKAADNSVRFVVGSTEAEESAVSPKFARGCAENAEPTDDALSPDSPREIRDSPIAGQDEAWVNAGLEFLRKKQTRRKERKRWTREKKMRAKQAKNPAASVEQSTSKYKVVSKSNKLDEQMNKLNEPEPVDISSDSDDSILEVPVPPKAPPPVIQLQDSDDEAERTRSPAKNREKSAPEPSNSSASTSEDSADNSAANPPQARHENAGQSGKNRATGHGKSAPEPSESPASTSEDSVDNSAVNPPQERDENPGKSGKNRAKGHGKSAPEPIDSSSRTCETDRADNSAAVSSVPRESDESTGKSVKNRLRKSKKSATEKREESAASSGSEREPSEIETSAVSPGVARKSRKCRKSADEVEADFPVDDANIGQIGGPPISPRVARATTKDARSAEISVPIASVSQGSDDKSPKNRQKRGKKSADEPREDIVASSCAKDTDHSEIGEARLQKILRDASKKAKDPEPRLPISCPEDGSLILNCTEIQKGASSLEEIRRMRENAQPIGHPHSDDSMTESEANNWVTIAAGQARNSSRVDEEICSIGSSIEPANSALWEDQTTRENRLDTSADLSAEVAPISADTSPILHAGNAATTSVATIDDRAETPRKRHKESRPFEDFDVPAIPEKRVRHNRQKTSREQTMTEYFFKPMSREMQAFYNNPWGGENLDVCDIQSRMPRNPKHWAILDADLQGAVSKRRRLCPRCKTDSHFGKRCPEKAKAPCCYMCGVKGHTETRCPDTMCLTCGRKYATYRPTCGFCSQLYCTMCNGAGHSVKNCPDLWRRYHNTTTDTLPMIPRDAASVMKPAQSLTCCNCARRGHDATTCRQLRWSQHFPTPTHVTSYTEGPTYEPAIPVQIGADRCYSHFIPEPSESRFTDHEAYNQPSREFAGAKNFVANAEPKETIEIVELADEVAESHPKNAPAKRRVIFHAGETNERKSSAWPGITRRLDTNANIELAGLRAGTSMPMFLMHWQKHFPFSVEIFEHEDSGRVFLAVKCRTRAILKELERVVWQWLERTDAEKHYLGYNAIPYRPNGSQVADELSGKVMALSKRWHPLLVLRKINAFDRKIERVNARTQIRRSVNGPKKKIVVDAMARRSQLVASLYRGSWVEDGEAKLRIYERLTRERDELAVVGKVLAPHDYLRLVHLYNEIFAFHENETLRRALESVFRATAPDVVASRKVKCVFPRAEVGIARTDDAGNSTAEVVDNQGADRAKAATNPAPKGAENSEDFSVTAATNAASSATNSASSATNFTAISANSSQRLDPSESPVNHVGDSTDDSQPTGESVAATQPSGISKLVASLSKKQRKLYRQTAVLASKVALCYGSQRMQSMARDLNRKIQDTIVRTSDVQELELAVNADVRTRKIMETLVTNERRKQERRKVKREYRRRKRALNKQPFKGVQGVKSTWEIAPTYVNFLKTL